MNGTQGNENRPQHKRHVGQRGDEEQDDEIERKCEAHPDFIYAPKRQQATRLAGEAVYGARTKGKQALSVMGKGFGSLRSQMFGKKKGGRRRRRKSRKKRRKSRRKSGRKARRKSRGRKKRRRTRRRR